MFAAGTDTTFTLLEWTISELIRHNDIISTPKNELKDIAGGNSNITEDDLDKCQYLKAVINETLRLRPHLPFLSQRESTKDVKLFTYGISAGTGVVINVWAIGRDPLLWVDPGKFWPERFLNSSLADLKTRFQLIPFGGGRRRCPGAAFVMRIVQLVVANLVLNFEFELEGGKRGEDLDMAEGDAVIVHRKFPLKNYC